MLLPELRARFDDIAQPPPRTSDVERLHLFESITEVLRRIAAGAPLVLVLDDLHWADKPTLLLLQYAAHNLDAAPVMFLGAYRDVEVDRVHPLAEALDALRRDPRFRRVHLRGLPEHEMAGFLPSNDGAPPDGLTAALSAGTEGNPFFAREVVRHLIEEGSLRNEDGRWTCARANSADLGIPEGVRDVIGRRLSRLSDDCNRMLAAASATTDGIAWDVLHAVVGDDDERLLDTLDEALDAHILREEGDGRTAKYDFTHALIRQTLYSEMSTPRRILLHRTIGEAMEQVYASDIDAHVTELAQHFYAAAPGGDVERAIDYARRSADRATSLFAWEEAAQQYERALEALEIMPVQDETQKCELFLLLVKAQLQTSEIAYDDKLTANAITAADIARSMGLPRQFAEAALAHDEAAGPAGVRVERPGRLLAEALEMQPDHDTAIRAMLIASLARHSLVRWEKTEALDLSSQALAMARRLNDLSALQDVLRKCHSVLAGPAHAEERLAIAREMRSISRSVEPGSEVRWTVMLQDLMELGEMAAAESELLDLEDDRDAFKSQSVAWVVEVARATIALARGCFEEAERLMQRAVQFSQGVEGDEPGLFFALQLFTLRLHQGRVDELGPLVENLMRQSPSPSLVLLLRCAQALVYSQTQREDEACVILHELSGDDLTFASLHEGELWMISMFLLTEVCWVIGDATRAHAIYERVLPYAERPVTVLGFGTTAGSVSRLLGQLATVTECWDDAERHFEDAVEFDTRLDTPPWLANTQYNYASMLLARRGPGDAARARTLLAAALKITQELGMIALQRKIKAAQA
jgi:tetratricopeptide (TPR) repeat protein